MIKFEGLTKRYGEATAVPGLEAAGIGRARLVVLTVGERVAELARQDGWPLGRRFATPESVSAITDTVHALLVEIEELITLQEEWLRELPRASTRVEPANSHARTGDRDRVEHLGVQLDRLKTDPITAGELQQAKNQFARDYILGRLSVQQKAGVLAHAAVIHDDLSTADGEFDIFMNTSAADVQRVAQTYFKPENRLVLTIMPRGGSTGGGR